VTTSRWRGWLMAGAIFILGVAVGSAGMAWTGMRVVRRALQAPMNTTGPADRAAVRIGADLTKTLQLNPEQSARVQTILEESAANLKRMRARVALSAAAELRTATERIAAELPAEKHAELYRVIAKRYERLGLRAPQQP
jgi:allophanate hydrolase subunit 2